jgi:hypothetical protein
MNWLRYGPLRRPLIRLITFLWKSGETPTWVLEFLYPEDALITFLDVTERKAKG